MVAHNSGASVGPPAQLSDELDSLVRWKQWSGHGWELMMWQALSRAAKRPPKRRRGNTLGCVVLLATSPTWFSGMACRPQDRGHPLPWQASAQAPGSGPASATIDTQRPRLVMSRTGVGVIHLCASLDTVDALFRNVRDTMFEAEGSRWRGKVVPYEHGEITFESSWVDSLRIWRISTNSADVRTPKGYHANMTVGDLVAAGEHPSIALPEGEVLIVLEADSVGANAIGATIDSASQAEFYRRYDFKGLPQLESIAPRARLTEMATSADCSAGRAR